MSLGEILEDARHEFLKGIGIPKPEPFVVDEFQREAIQLVANGCDTLVVAPTGSGKTYIAFESIRACPPIEKHEDNTRFCELLQTLLEDGLLVLPRLAQGLSESAAYYPPEQKDLDLYQFARVFRIIYLIILTLFVLLFLKVFYVSHQLLCLEYQYLQMDLQIKLWNVCAQTQTKGVIHQNYYYLYRSLSVVNHLGLVPFDL